MGSHDADTDYLIRLASEGNASAAQQLLGRNRRRLWRMVQVRMDPRLSARLDPSYVVQEALAPASQKLPEYLKDRAIAFYP